MIEEREVYEVGVVLPHDYDDLWGVQGANEEIQNLLKQVIEAKTTEHEAEMAEMLTNYKDRLKVAETAVEELNERCEKLQQENVQKENQIQALQNDLRTAIEAKEEAEKKRDNAVRLMEEAQAEAEELRKENERFKRSEESLKSQINELEAMLGTYKQKKSSGGLGGLQLTSTLTVSSEEELKAKRERERLEFINRRLVEKFGGAVAPIDIPPLPSTEPAEEDVSEETIAEQMKRVEEAAKADAETFPVAPDYTGEDPAAGGAETACVDAPGIGEKEAETDATSIEARLAALEDRVSRLEERFG